MIDRRLFNQLVSAFAFGGILSRGKSKNYNSISTQDGPLIISTWNNQEANRIALNKLISTPDALLDAIELAVNSVESNPRDSSVGFGGLPDNSGKVSLDACIMDADGNAGSVCFLRDIKHAVSVARRVMEKTPHVILAGDGAQSFALSGGFQKEDLTTEATRKAYSQWKEKSIYAPKVNSERHDTIGLLALNSGGQVAGACSTSGLAYKIPGRVGDSPIIGAGLFVDNEIGAATATGLGELVLKSCSSFLVVEFMRQGLAPREACEKALIRLIEKQNVENKQVGLIALRKDGTLGACSIRPGFNYTVANKHGISVIEAASIIQ